MQVVSKSLEQAFFKNNIDISIIEEILDTLDDHVKLEVINREEYILKNENILEENKKMWKKEWEKYWKFYTLYLPIDLKISELSEIIYKINKLTFWENIPKYSQIEEFKLRVVLIVDTILEKIVDNRGQTEKIIKKYSYIYSRLLWGDLYNLCNTEYRKLIIENVNIGNRKEKLNQEIWKSLRDINLLLSNDLVKYFDLSLSDRAEENTRMKQRTITQDEFYKIAEKKTKMENWEIDWNINIRIPEKFFPKIKNEEILLRQRLNIDDKKKELKQIRKYWNLEEIEQKELDILNEMMKILSTLIPYQFTSERFWWKPSKILKTKETFCLWFSWIWHSFLKELWIKHKALTIIETMVESKPHSVLEVEIGENYYHFDPTKFDHVEKCYHKNISWLDILRVELENGTCILQEVVVSWKAEEILLADIYVLSWEGLSNEWKYDEANGLLNRASNIVSNNPIYYNNTWVNYYRQWKYNEAMIEYNKALKLYPNYSSAHFNKAVSFRKLGHYKEAINEYNRTLETNILDGYIYINKWHILKELQRHKLYCLNMFTWLKLKNPQESDFCKSVEKLYPRECGIINTFIKNKLFFRLRKYMINLERWNLEYNTTKN